MRTLRTIWGHHRALAGGLVRLGAIVILLAIGLILAGTALALPLLSLLELGP